MIGHSKLDSGDAIHNRLLHDVIAINGAYDFAPSQALLEEILAADEFKT